jgi:hypothetical protein
LIADKLKTKYLEQYRVATRFVQHKSQYFKMMSISNKKLIRGVLNKTDSNIPLDSEDTLLFTLNKRFMKYICFYNARKYNGGSQIYIIESDVIGNLRKSFPFRPELLQDLARCANAS